MTEDTSPAARGVISAVTAGAAAASALTGHPLGAVLGSALFTGLQPYMEAAWVRVRAVFDGAAKRTGCPVEKLVEDLGSSPAKRELLAETLAAAQTAALEEKQLALAETLAAGATASDEDGAVTRELMLVRAITDLESPHLAVLKRLDGEAQPVPDEASGRLEWWLLPGGWCDERTLQALPGIGDLCRPILVTLERHGLVEPQGPEDRSTIVMRRGESWRLTQHGDLLLERLAAGQGGFAL